VNRDEQARAQLKQYGVIRVRTLKPNEAMPQHLGTGFEQMVVMNDFVWVAEKGGKIIGILMAAPCHGVIFFVRLRTEKDAPPMAVTLLFRKCVRDCQERGFKGYFTYVDPSIEAERKFIPICRKAGGAQITSLQVGLVGRLGDAARY
jgi:hypothetical protein